MYWDAIGTIFSTERTRSMLDRDRDLAMVVLLCEGSGSMMKEVYRRCRYYA